MRCFTDFVLDRQSKQFIVVKSSSSPVKQRKTVSTSYLVSSPWNHEGSLTDPSSTMKLAALDSVAAGREALRRAPFEVGRITRVASSGWRRGRSCCPMCPEAAVTKIVLGIGKANLK